MRGLAIRPGLVPQVLRGRLCDELRFAWWQRSRVTGNDGAGQWVSPCRTSETCVERYFTDQMRCAMAELDQLLHAEIGIDLASLEGWQALRYGARTAFGLHHDDRAGRLDRAVSITVFLQEPDAGGELVFPWHDLTIEPTAGAVVAWTNRWPDGVPDVLASHQIEPIIGGTRLSLVNWASTQPNNHSKWSSWT